jgi:hypothetical protein
MLNLATLYAQELEYGTLAYLTPFQYKLLCTHFYTDVFQNIARNLDDISTDFKKLQWTSTEPYVILGCETLF